VQLITVTLDDKTSQALDRWLARTAAATGPPRLTADEAIPAMVRVCLGFTDISNLVASHIRAERVAEKLDTYQSRQGPGSLLPGKVVGPLCSGPRRMRCTPGRPASCPEMTIPHRCPWFSAYSIASSLASRMTEQGEVAPVEPHPSGPAPPHRRNGCFPCTGMTSCLIMIVTSDSGCADQY
jgi:hypothetical protein